MSFDSNSYRVSTKEEGFATSDSKQSDLGISLSLSLVLPSQAISSFPFLAFKQPWVFSFLGRNLFPVRTVSPFVLTDVASSGGGALGGFVSSPPTSFGCRRRQFCDASCMPLASVARLDCN